ncbi:xanthine dehydrogenase family protein molybdopterin-binding subunit [Roseibium sp. CAU 1637]|uniref:Xanthine dehydrogenase family protein molybdopterin-binding subunit n=1 Tax=Roseibium limicola TaxID=2816037 RepID=A0A939J8Q0_9HYPH|nr:xanthine dehydrogenase family protein molybdopterin-binding subunit [Roseibium limicola]MBO0345531.1 xanthine dehydrogenase family protein molybdopterin-binding subunit [Roseibium limicola]
MTSHLTRRSFLARAGTELVIAVVLPSLARAQAIRRMTPAEMREAPAAPSAFLRIGEDDSVTVISKHIEFGQGTFTGLAMLAAEELDADWSQMRVEAAPSEVTLYANLNMGMQGTGGSSAMANSYYQMRKAGAAARSMLVAAAAQEWNVQVKEILVERGVISHAASGRSSGFGAFATLAATMPLMLQPDLKDPETFRLIGTDLPRIDGDEKSTGKAVYSIDVERENMVQSAVLHPPVFGATLKQLDAAAADAIPGVLATVQLDRGVGVIAQTRFAAQRGVAALQADWDMSAAETRSSEEMFRTYAEATKTPGADTETRGLGAKGLEGTVRQVEAEYRFPFLAHAPMEPMGAVVDVQSEKAEFWMGSQLVTRDKTEIVKVLGMQPEQVDIHTMFAGGSFGRLGTPDAEFAAEVAAIGKAWGKGPVKHLWSRENDIRGGRYRPMSVHRLRGGIDEKGNVTAWDQVIAIQSFLKGTAFDGAVRNGVDRSAVEGARGVAYDIPNFHVGLHLMENGVTGNFWRSVGSSHTCFAVETFLDELFALGGVDPVQGRLSLISDEETRLRNVLERAADMADWSGVEGKPGRALGVAIVKCFRSYVAEIVEVSRGEDSLPKVHKVWCAVDCGVAINPDVIRAQMEGGIGFALGAAMYSEITIGAGGRPEQGNFDLFRSIRMSEMPEIEVSIVKSTADPTGVGEPGVPPIAPAVANAWRALTGKSIRTLPFSRGVMA